MRHQNNQLLALAGDNWNIYLWDVSTEEIIKELEFEYPAPNTQISALTFSPDGQILVSGEDILKFWDINTGEVIGTFDITKVIGKFDKSTSQILHIEFNAPHQLLLLANLWSISHDKSAVFFLKYS